MQFTANGYQLYDISGNVWGWCSDLFNENYYKEIAGTICKNPTGAKKSYNPRDPYATERVTKGGSFLATYLTAIIIAQAQEKAHLSIRACLT